MNPSCSNERESVHRGKRFPGMRSNIYFQITAVFLH